MDTNSNTELFNKIIDLEIDNIKLKLDSDKLKLDNDKLK